MPPRLLKSTSLGRAVHRESLRILSSAVGECRDSGCLRSRMMPGLSNPSGSVWPTDRLVHPDVAVVDRVIGDARSGTISTAAGAG